MGWCFSSSQWAVRQVISPMKYYVNYFLAAPNVLGTAFFDLQYVDPAFTYSPISTLVSSWVNVDLNYSVIMRNLGS